MALSVYFHHGHVIGTYQVVKAADEPQARQYMAQLLSQPHFAKQDASKLFGYQLTRDDAQKEKYQDLFHKINVNLIRRSNIV